jgi:hypothetical protein
MAAGQWIPQCSAAERKSVSTNLTKRNFFLIGFRLTGPRGGRFSPAADVITFSGLIHLTSAPPHYTPTKFLLKAYKNK